MELFKLFSNCRDKNTLTEINNEAFPPYERMNIDDMFYFAQNTDTDVLGIYENDALIGFMLLVKNKSCAYLYFFAISKNMRSKGYGGRAIKELFRMYSNLQIILDFEVLEPEAPNIEQRKQRRDFYLRNGLLPTGTFTMLRNNKFEVVCNGGDLNKEEFMEILKVINKYVPEFPAALF